MKRIFKYLFFAMAAFAMISLVHAAITSPMSATIIPQCQYVNYPRICQRTFEKCGNIDLDDACMALAQLEGQLGRSVTSSVEKPMSQNNFMVETK